MDDRRPQGLGKGTRIGIAVATDTFDRDAGTALMQQRMIALSTP